MRQTHLLHHQLVRRHALVGLVLLLALAVLVALVAR